MSDELKGVAANIRALRLAHRIGDAKKPPSQTALAGEMNVSQALVNHWEKTGRITMEDTFRLANFFGVTASQIVTGTPPSDSEPASDREVDVASLGLALVALDEGGLNDKDDLTKEQHARALALLYNLARNLKARGIGSDEAQGILTADAEKVLMLVTMDQTG